MIVIPMAGLSSRFFKAGFQQPKWMLPLADRPLLDWSLLSFRMSFETEPFLIIYYEKPGTRAFIQERTQELGIRNLTLVGLSEPTRGQAETVALGLERASVPDDAPITIFNIDTIRPDFRLPEPFTNADGWLECFLGEGDHWSFVKSVQNGSDKAAQVVEKKRISPYCCTGMYFFGSADHFRTAYQTELLQPSSTELFVAPLYQHMIDANMCVQFSVIEADKIFFSGTPDEYTTALGEADKIRKSFY